MTSTTLERPLGAARIPDRLARLLRGRTDDPAWARPSLLGLLAATALLYLWAPERLGLGQRLLLGRRPGRASQSWKAFFFGSSDAANFITVDKPPAALWVDGAVGPAVRGQLLEPAGAPGADGRGHGRRSSTRPCAAGSARRPGCSPGRSSP